MFGYNNLNETLSPASANGQLLSMLAFAINPDNVPGASSILDTISSILTAPLLFFQQNYINPNSTSHSSFVPIPGLASDLYASVDLATEIIVGVIPRWTAIVYTIILMAILLSCVTGVIASSLFDGPNVSSFPVIDFVSRVLTNRESSLANALTNLTDGGDNDVRVMLAKEKLCLMHIAKGAKESEKKLGFA